MLRTGKRAPMFARRWPGIERFGNGTDCVLDAFPTGTLEWPLWLRSTTKVLGPRLLDDGRAKFSLECPGRSKRAEARDAARARFKRRLRAQVAVVVDTRPVTE